MKKLLTTLIVLVVVIGLSSCTMIPTPYGYAVMFGGKGAMKSNMSGNPTVIAPR